MDTDSFEDGGTQQRQPMLTYLQNVHDRHKRLTEEIKRLTVKISQFRALKKELKHGEVMIKEIQRMREEIPALLITAQEEEKETVALNRVVLSQWQQRAADYPGEKVPEEKDDEEEEEETKNRVTIQRLITQDEEDAKHAVIQERIKAAADERQRLIDLVNKEMMKHPEEVWTTSSAMCLAKTRGGNEKTWIRYWSGQQQKVETVEKYNGLVAEMLKRMEDGEELHSPNKKRKRATEERTPNRSMLSPNNRRPQPQGLDPEIVFDD